jgi:hypothetical protein
MLAAKTGRKKVDIVRMLLEDGLKEVDGWAHSSLLQGSEELLQIIEIL